MVICSRVRAKDHARTFDTYEQWAIAEFAEAGACRIRAGRGYGRRESKALLTIPKTLAINAALDAIDLLAALRARWELR